MSRFRASNRLSLPALRRDVDYEGKGDRRLLVC